MKPVTTVVFTPDCPVELKDFDPLPYQTPAGLCQTIRCSEVRETLLGFVQLVPFRTDGGLVVTLFVSPAHILYMARCEDDSSVGFLPATEKAAPLPGQAG